MYSIQLCRLAWPYGYQQQDQIQLYFSFKELLQFFFTYIFSHLIAFYNRSCWWTKQSTSKSNVKNACINRMWQLGLKAFSIITFAQVSKQAFYRQVLKEKNILDALHYLAFCIEIVFYPNAIQKLCFVHRVRNNCNCRKCVHGMCQLVKLLFKRNGRKECNIIQYTLILQNFKLMTSSLSPTVQ